MSALREDAPLISICVPTHEGRRATLSALLECIMRQASDLPGRIEVCISDNGSRDGTTAMVGDIARGAPCHVTYERREVDLGHGPNLLAVTQLARGQYCWLLSSDELLAEDALRRVCEMLGALPGATGYVVGAVYVDENDPSLRSRALATALHPAGEEPRMITGIDAIYDECGNSWCAVSWHLVDRERWQRVALARRDLVLAHPVFPHLVMLATIAAERPVWGWLPGPLVHQRNATTALFDHGEVSLADRWSHIIRTAAEAWADVLPARGRRWRTRMRLVHQVWGGAEDIWATKLYGRPTVREQGWLALACLRAFWPDRVYWREVLVATLTPVWLARALFAPDSRWTSRVRSDVPRLSLSTTLPSELRAESVSSTTATIIDGRQRRIPLMGPRAITVGWRWCTLDGRALTPQDLGVNFLAALPQTLGAGVRASRAFEAEVILYAPRSPGTYSLELVAYQRNGDASGCARTSAVRVAVVA
jgi:glycosyltransferase involved in cell wall biosynthesis